LARGIGTPIPGRLWDRLSGFLEGLSERGVLVLVAGGGEEFERHHGHEAIRPAWSVASQRGRTAGSRWRTQAEVSTTSGTAANGSAKVGFALGVDLACALEVVVGLAAREPQQVISGGLSTLAFVALGSSPADGKIADQPRTAGGAGIDRGHRLGELGVDGHLNAWQ
jgi:hypothetical protein